MLILGFETSCITTWSRKTKWKHGLKALHLPKL